MYFVVYGGIWTSVNLFCLEMFFMERNITEEKKKQIVLDSIKNFGYPCHLKYLLISNKFGEGFLGTFSQIELATYPDGHTHIGVKDVLNILGDEKEFLCRCNNKLLKSVLSNIDALVNNGALTFSSYNFREQRSLTYTDVGVLDADVQKLYTKYIMGFFQ